MAAPRDGHRRISGAGATRRTRSAPGVSAPPTSPGGPGESPQQGYRAGCSRSCLYRSCSLFPVVPGFCNYPPYYGLVVPQFEFSGRSRIDLPALHSADWKGLSHTAPPISSALVTSAFAVPRKTTLRQRPMPSVTTSRCECRCGASRASQMHSRRSSTTTAMRWHSTSFDTTL